jgi:hypothetical protein
VAGNEGDAQQEGHGRKSLEFYARNHSSRITGFIVN